MQVKKCPMPFCHFISFISQHTSKQTNKKSPRQRNVEFFFPKQALSHKYFNFNVNDFRSFATLLKQKRNSGLNGIAKILWLRKEHLFGLTFTFNRFFFHFINYKGCLTFREGCILSLSFWSSGSQGMNGPFFIIFCIEEIKKLEFCIW